MGMTGPGSWSPRPPLRWGKPALRPPPGRQVSEWEYDAGGRLVREFTPAGPRTYAYDAAGQLVSVTEPDGSRTEYVYDGLGRRSRLIGPDGSWTEYAWGETGYLQGTVDRTPDGAEAARHELVGGCPGRAGCPWMAARCGGTPPAGIPPSPGIGTEQVLNLPGGVTGVGEAWMAPGWRAARPTDETDPWAVLGPRSFLNPELWPAWVPGAVRDVRCPVVCRPGSA